MFRFALNFFMAAIFVPAAQAAPLKCPSIASIKAQGLSSVDVAAPDFYVIYTNSFYDTEENWLFAIGPIKAHSEESAMNVAIEYLQDISGNPEPRENRDSGYFACEYHINSKDSIAYAFLGIESPDTILRHSHHW